MYDVAKADTINSDCGVLIIVKSSDVYSKFDELNTELRDKFDMQDAGLTAISYPVPNMPDVTAIYFDDKTGEYDALPMYEDVQENS